MAVIRDPGPSESQSLTFEAFGNAEDFSPIITNIDPTTTPFLSSLTADANAKEPEFSWITEALRPPIKNAHLEKEDYKTEKVGSLRSLSNNVQIFQNTGWVSDMQRKTEKIYTEQDEFVRQKQNAFLAHAKDIEYALVTNETRVKGTASVPAETGGIPYFLNSSALAVTVATSGLCTTAENHELSTGDFIFFVADTLPTGLKADVPYYVNVKSSTTFNIYSTMKGAIDSVASKQVKPTDAGTNVKVERNNVVDLGGKAESTLDDIDSMLYKAQLRGAHPGDLWMNPINKRRFSKQLLANSTNIRKGAEKKLNLVADTYESDFGIVTAHPHLFYPNDRIDAIDTQYMTLKWFDRTHEVTGLAKKGNYSEFVIECSIGLKCTQPQAHGSITNIKI
jgi:hypothetical protein